MGDLITVTCVTNGSTVQAWTSSITSPSPPFVSVIGDTIGLVYNSMAVLVVHLRAADVTLRSMRSTLKLSVTMSAKFVGVVVQCADNTQGLTGVRVGSLLFKQFTGKAKV